MYTLYLCMLLLLFIFGHFAYYSPANNYLRMFKQVTEVAQVSYSKEFNKHTSTKKQLWLNVNNLFAYLVSGIKIT